MEIHPVGAELSHADGQMDRRTDVTSVVLSLHSFADAPTNSAPSYNVPIPQPVLH